MSRLGPGLPEFIPRKEYKLFDIFKCRDGSDSLPTVARYTGYGAVTGALVSAYDILGYTSPSTLSGALSVCYKHVVPLAAVGGVYSAVTCISANVRNKNDQYNHFFAGLAAGSVYGFKYSSQKVGWGVGLALGITGMLLKRAYIENWQLFPMYFYREKGFTHYRDAYLTSRPNPEGRDDLKAPAAGQQ